MRNYEVPSETPQKLPENETKTQNTQDYRKKDDFNLDEMNFNFSEEKPINNFTRFDIYPDGEDARPSEMDSFEYEYDNKRMNKNQRMQSRYQTQNEDSQLEIAEEADPEVKNISFSDEKVVNTPNLDDEKPLVSLDSWSNQDACIEEFLNAGSQSFNNSSIKMTPKINPEISCDNPLEMDSNAESKQLELADLDTKHRVSISMTIQDQYEENKVSFNESRGLVSRNKERHLSRDNSSICNFKSMDVTHNSCSSSGMDEFEVTD